MIKKLTLIVLITFCVSILMGCNAFRGLGKEIESLGGAMKIQVVSQKRNERWSLIILSPLFHAYFLPLIINFNVYIYY